MTLFAFKISISKRYLTTVRHIVPFRQREDWLVDSNGTFRSVPSQTRKNKGNFELTDSRQLIG